MRLNVVYILCVFLNLRSLPELFYQIMKCKYIDILIMSCDKQNKKGGNNLYKLVSRKQINNKETLLYKEDLGLRIFLIKGMNDKGEISLTKVISG